MVVLTTGKVSIVGLNINVQAVLKIGSNVQHPEVLKMRSAGAQEKNGSRDVDQDLEYNECPDRPLLSSRVGMGNAEKERAKAKTAEHGTEITPYQRNESIFECIVPMVGLQVVDMTAKPVVERNL